ncbi:MAG TPA: thioredoxin-dependent thiol peroxidase [bacterium]|nr:thioredoxin-dependent thiol peroxidase [bacterium]
MPKLAEGKPAPDFSLSSTEGKPLRLSDFKGKNVVLYFYPKDNTPGCTREACDFRDSVRDIQKRDAVILGVSADSLKAHEKFKDQFKLPFPLLSDEGKEVLKKYGVWKQKSFMGKTFMGIERTTVIIDKKGNIRKIFPKVKVDGHRSEVLEILKSL